MIQAVLSSATSCHSRDRLHEVHRLRQLVPPMFPIPVTAVVMSLLLEQAFGKNDLDNSLHGFRAGPVALELNGERDPAGRLPTRLNHTLEARAMGLDGSAADRVDDRIYLVAVSHGVERGKRHADLGPEGADDELAPAGRANRIEEIRVFPCVGW